MPRTSPFPTPLTREKQAGRRGAPRITLTDAQLQWLRRYYPLMDNTSVISLTGISRSILFRLAAEHGLVKTPAAGRAIRRRQAERARRTRAARGHYEAMRGKPLSDQCYENLRQWWKRYRQGLEEHPFQIMRRKHPHKYRQMLADMSQRRKDLIRAERRRALYGLPRRTALSTPLTPYTRRQTHHRYSARRRGYIVHAECAEGSGQRFKIYYTPDTRRTPLFERNLVADGFTILPSPS